jgi:hypothetical protein
MVCWTLAAGLGVRGVVMTPWAEVIIVIDITNTDDSNKVETLLIMDVNV